MTSRHPAGSASAGIVVRPCAEADVDELVARWHATNIAAYPYVAEQQRHTEDDARGYFTGTVLPTCRVFVAERAGECAGLMATEGCWIRHLAVFAAHRRHGVARALLEVARAGSPHELRLFTFARNAPARALYEAEGFVAVREGRSPSPEDEPDVEYRWTPSLVR